VRRFRKPLKPSGRSSEFWESDGPLGQVLREDLEGDFSIQAGVFSEIDFAHAALAYLLQDLVVRKILADHGLVGGDEAFEFLEPVQDDIDLGTDGFSAIGPVRWENHEQSFAVGTHVVIPVAENHVESLDWKRLLVAEPKGWSSDNID
jgi:hypothetical protein